VPGFKRVEAGNRLITLAGGGVSERIAHQSAEGSFRRIFWPKISSFGLLLAWGGRSANTAHQAFSSLNVTSVKHVFL